MRPAAALSVLLLLALGAPAAAAPSAALPPPELATPEPPPSRRNFIVPSFETIGIHLVLNGYSRYNGSPWATSDLDTTRANLRSQWVYDADGFSTNQLGHPYQGALYMQAARSSGFGFFGALPWVLTGSTLWEVAGENEPPSLNDEVTTTIGGAFLGEALHRLAVATAGPGGLLRGLASAAVAPMTGLNRGIIGLRGQPRREPAIAARFRVGRRFAQKTWDVADPSHRLPDPSPAHLDLAIAYRTPGADRAQEPFDHFDFQLRLASSTQPFEMVLVRGLLWRRPFERGAFRGQWGLVGSYDYVAPEPIRVSTTSIGAGAGGRLETRLGAVDLQGYLAAIPLGSAGANTPGPGARDYRIGPGAQALVSAALTAGRARVEASLREYLVGSGGGIEGWESVRHGSAAASWRFAGANAISVEGAVSHRRAQHPEQELVRQMGTSLSVYWAIFTQATPHGS